MTTRPRAKTIIIIALCQMMIVAVGCGGHNSGTHDDSGTNENIARCGNGVREPGEACDGADLGGETCQLLGRPGGTLACGDDCTLELSRCDPPVTCGNGAVDTGEECDGANLDGETCETLGLEGGTLTCSEGCVFDTSDCFSCGDGIRNGNEECDGVDLGESNDCATATGHASGSVACTAACTLDVSQCYTCGDGLVDGAEVCDATNFGQETCFSQTGLSDGTLSCMTSCLTLDTSGCFECGNGTREPVEDCDGSDLGGQTCASLGTGFTGGLLACDQSCGFDTTSCAICGNGIVEPTERCDDANSEPWDGCYNCEITEFMVNVTTQKAQRFPAAVALPGGRMAMVWSNGHPSISAFYRVYLRIMDADGSFATDEIQVSNLTSYSQEDAAITASENGIITVAWTYGPWNSGTTRDVHYRQFDDLGTPLGAVASATAGQSGYISGDRTTPLRTLPDGGFVIALTLDNNVSGDWRNVFLRRFEATGAPSGPAQQINTYVTDFQNAAGVSVSPSGNMLVTWESSDQDGDGEGIFAQRLDVSGIPVGQEFQVNINTVGWQRFANSTYLLDESFVIIWYDYDTNRDIGRLYDSAGLPLTGEVVLAVNVSSGGTAIGTLASGEIVFVDTTFDVSSNGIFLRFFSPSLVLLGPAVQVNVYTSDSQSAPSLTIWPDDRFAVLWHSFGQDGDSLGIFGQRFDATGTTVGRNPW